jgi:hypothetical protein
VCSDVTSSLTLSGGFAWSFGIHFKSGPLNAWPIHPECTANLKAYVGGKLETHSVRTWGGYPDPCPSCEETTFGPTLTASGEGVCTIEYGAHKTLPVEGALSAEYGQEMTYTKKSGACGSEGCLTSTIKGKMEAGLSSSCLKVFGRGVKVGLKASIEGELSGSSCAGAPNSGPGWKHAVATSVLGRCNPN